MEHLTKLRHLIKLYVGGTRVTNAGVRKLKSALPECAVNVDPVDL
jgi:hypothetical protein